VFVSMRELMHAAHTDLAPSGEIAAG
jgi:hypothetical protein